MYFSFFGFVGSCRLVFAKQYITASSVFEQRKCIFPKSGSLPQKSPISRLYIVGALSAQSFAAMPANKKEKSKDDVPPKTSLLRFLYAMPTVNMRYSSRRPIAVMARIPLRPAFFTFTGVMNKMPSTSNPPTYQ